MTTEHETDGLEFLYSLPLNSPLVRAYEAQRELLEVEYIAPIESDEKPKDSFSARSRRRLERRVRQFTSVIKNKEVKWALYKAAFIRTRKVLQYMVENGHVPFPRMHKARANLSKIDRLLGQFPRLNDRRGAHFMS